MRSQPNSTSITRSRKRRGGAVLETAMVLPIVIMLGFGVVDYGYVIYLTNTFQAAAQAGARTAIVDTSQNSDVTSTISTLMTAAGIPAANYTVTLSPSNISGLSSGTTITVTITGTWGTLGTKILPQSFGGMSTSKQIVGVSVMQKEP
jgi:Flp pilus assembly protein TadG